MRREHQNSHFCGRPSRSWGEGGGARGEIREKGKGGCKEGEKGKGGGKGEKRESHCN